MFERYSEKARRAIFFAQYEAGNYGSPTIESEHLLLGLLRETALLQRLLKTGRESLEILRREIERQIIRRPAIHVEISFSLESKHILDYTGQEAERLGHGRVEPEHLVLGLLRDDQCFGARVLHAHEVTLSRVRDEITNGKREGEVKAGETRAREWCCPDFQSRCYQPGKKENGLGIVMWFRSRGPLNFALEYRRPDRAPSEPICEDGIKLKFCPWCGRNLADWYSSGLPPFDQPEAQQ
jgi:ATP-dependent Clp protease ATP-binding subunit ClpA